MDYALLEKFNSKECPINGAILMKFDAQYFHKFTMDKETTAALQYRKLFCFPENMNMRTLLTREYIESIS